MLDTLLGFYQQYPSSLLGVRQIPQTVLDPELLEELEFHGRRQFEILQEAQTYLLDEPAQLMLQGLSAKMKRDGLDNMFSHVQLPFPAMLLTVPEPSDGVWPSALVKQHEGKLYTQLFHETKEGFVPNLLIFRSVGADVEALYAPTYKVSMVIGDKITDEMAIEQEKPLALSFLRIVIGMSILLRHKAMLEIEKVPAFPRALRRRAEKSGRPLPDKRIVKIRLGELGRGQLQAMQEDAGDVGAGTGNSENEVLVEKSRRRAHWVQGHFMRNRAGGISWRNPHIRGAGPVINQERHVSVAKDELP